MRLNSAWSRRGFRETATTVAASIFAPLRLFSKAGTPAAGTAIAGFGHSGNPYDELGHESALTTTEGGRDGRRGTGSWEPRAWIEGAPRAVCVLLT
jgi:hypothetical protein